MGKLDYRLGERIRCSKHAEVFRGTLPDSRAVAIKRFFVEPGNQATSNACAEQEATLASRLAHPNLVTLLGMERDSEQRLCLVYEWVDGIDLATWRNEDCHDGIASANAAVFLARELLQALDYLHTQAGILHRDLTPGNVLLAWDGTVKLIDLGIARPTAIVAALFGSRRVAPVGSLRPEIPVAFAELIDKLIARHRMARWPTARDVLLALPECPTGRAELVDALQYSRNACQQNHAAAARESRPTGSVPTESMVDCALMSRYELEECIGRGGMAEVWRGWRTLASGFREPVAIKKILPYNALEPEALTRLDREAKLCLGLNHEHVVKVFDYVAEGDERWLVMEYIDGLSLMQIIERSITLSHEILRAILHHVLHALCYVHERGILHRDISPANIMLTRDGHVRLMDFGLFKNLTDDAKISAFKGTPAYASREALLGEELDTSSDLYSLAAVFYELLLGEPPYKRGPRQQVVLYHLGEPLLPLPDLMPVDFRAVLGGLLQRRDKRQFRTATEVIAILIHLGSDLDVAEPTTIASVVEQAMTIDEPLRVVEPPEQQHTSRRETVPLDASAVVRIQEWVEVVAPVHDMHDERDETPVRVEAAEQLEQAPASPEGAAEAPAPAEQTTPIAQDRNSSRLARHESTPSKPRRSSPASAVSLVLVATAASLLVAILATANMSRTSAPALVKSAARNPAAPDSERKATPEVVPKYGHAEKAEEGSAPAAQERAQPRKKTSRTGRVNRPESPPSESASELAAEDLEIIWQVPLADRLRLATP